MQPRLAAALALAASGLACASAVNYLDPSGPSYVYARAGATPGSDSPAKPLRVVTFNIAYAVEIDRAIEVLRRSEPLRDPDILALQEMDAPGTERIARALGMNAVYFPSGIHPKHRRDFGCAVLSPWPLEEPRKLVLPRAARGTHLRRSAVGAVVVRRGQRIRAYSVHLPSPLAVSGGSRKEQLRALAADAASAEGPVVIAGDFNSHDKVEELAKAGFSWVTRDVGPTAWFRLLGFGLAGLSYDHVLARGLRRAEGAGATGVVADNRGASDHRPVWAVLD
ncbi:MAG TPA: endonuclease/exonuclease/phosphatase family protein [Vicinamibacteria bacterium]|nr:endonuclease/exonuclease/phosphatase family protein [Vicinamibacteria bacterium]